MVHQHMEVRLFIVGGGALDLLLKKGVSAGAQMVAQALDSILKNGKVVSLMMDRVFIFIGTCVGIYCVVKDVQCCHFLSKACARRHVLLCHG